jgi:CRP/FNR family transcriptional regulator, cyclic AMP receptor protein
MSDPLFARYGREYPAGEVLFREGMAGDIMFVLQSGSVRITKHIAGEEKFIALLGPGEFLGEMAILNQKPRTGTATVIEHVRALVIDARTLEVMLTRNTEIAVRLIKKLAKRLDAADALVEIFMHRDPKARVMLALSRHAESFGVPTPNGIRIRTTPTELAGEVGVDPAVALEVMARLRRLRLADEEPGAIMVADVGRLQEFLEFMEMPQKFGGES